MAVLLAPPPPSTTTRAAAVGLGEARAVRATSVADADLLVAYGLGSCVAVCLFDASTGVAGMAHVVLPGIDPTGSPNPKFAQSVLPALVEHMRRAGSVADPRRFQARLAGGAQVLALGGSGALPPIGAQNAASVRQVLGDARVPVVGEDLGGKSGRTVWFDPRDGGRIRVRSVGGEERLL